MTDDRAVPPPAAAAQAERLSAFERLMDRRVPLWAVGLLCVLGFVAMVAFGALVLRAERGGKRFAWLQQPALALADFPDLLVNFRARTADPYLAPSAIDTRSPAGFSRNPASGFTDPGYLLLAAAGKERGAPYVQLLRLSDGKVLREYHPDTRALRDEAQAHATDATRNAGLPFWVGHPELMADGGLVINGTYLIARLDACARTRWSLPAQHHSIELDGEGMFWAPTVLAANRRPGATNMYLNDALTRISPDGKILSATSVADILDRNGMAALYLGKEYSDDPFHLNDIEPVLADGPHWKRGDLFLSFRHLSMLALYRPSTGRILWSKLGPWIGQHDVNILDDHRIAVFDNHSTFTPQGPQVLGHSDELVYDFATGQVTAPWSAGMARLGLAANSNGRGTPLADGSLFVEESNGGRIVRIGPRGELQWRYIHAGTKGERYRLFWSRYLDPVRYRAALAATLAAKCS